MLAPSGAAFGEVQQGLRVARDLVRRGEDVVFSAPAALAVLFEVEAVAYRPNDDDLLSLPQVLRTAVQADGLASLTLVDLASSALTFDALGIDIAHTVSLASSIALGQDRNNCRRR